MNGNFDDLETNARKSAVIQERMSLVSSHMYKQFLEYQQSNANTAILFDKMVENMALINVLNSKEERQLAQTRKLVQDNYEN